MKKKLNEFFKGEAFKMRDVAFGPAITILSVLPIALIVIVAIIVIFAIVKIVKISKDKDKVE